jgi:FkbM family methyltransferase
MIAMRYLRLIRYLANWWLHFGIKWAGVTADPVVFRTRSGVRIEVPRRLMHEFKEIFLDACYLRGMPLPVGLRPAIVDIGANAGFFSLFAAARHRDATIVAYEPVAANYAQLERNRDLNPLVRLTAVQQAVSSHRGRIELSAESNGSLTTAASALSADATRSVRLEVPCVTLEDIFRDHQLQSCDWLKIDCEGAEYDILYNCPATVLQRIRQMVIEVHRGPRPEQNITALGQHLATSGCRTRAIDDVLWAWQPEGKRP